MRILACTYNNKNSACDCKTRSFKIWCHTNLGDKTHTTELWEKILFLYIIWSYTYLIESLVSRLIISSLFRNLSQRNSTNIKVYQCQPVILSKTSPQQRNWFQPRLDIFNLWNYQNIYDSTNLISTDPLIYCCSLWEIKNIL